MANYLIPQFTMGDTARVDFSPINNVLSAYRDQQQKNRTFEEGQRQFNAQNVLAQRASTRADELQPWHIKQIQSGIDNSAGQLSLARRAQDRADEYAPYHIQHTKAQIDHLIQQGASEADLRPLKLLLQQSQVDYYKARAQAAAAKATPTPPPLIGQDKDGNYYLQPGSGPIPAPQGRPAPIGPDDDETGGSPAAPQGGGSVTYNADYGTVNLPPAGPAMPRPMPVGGRPYDRTQMFSPNNASASEAFGPTGQMAPSVPGIVTTPKGVTDQPATMAAAGQRGIEQRSPDEEARQRYLNAKQSQEIGRYLFGPAPRGMAYNSQGRLIPLSEKESVQDRQSIAIAQEGLKALDYAEKTLSRSGTLAQVAGDQWSIPGGFGAKIGGIGEAGRGFRSAKAAVMDLNFAISGKSVSNAEREAFLGIYMPTATDSRETQAWKLGRVRSFFNTALQARKSGATDEQIADLYRSDIIKGQAGDINGGGGQPAQAPAPPQNPAATRLKNKYGLE